MADDEEVGVRLVVNGREVFSSEMHKAAADMAALRAEADKTNASMGKVGASAEQARSPIRNLAGDSSSLRKSVNDLFSPFDQLSRSVDKAGTAALNFNKTFTTVIAGGAIAATAAIVGFGLKSAAAIQNLQLSFQALTGSQQAGIDMFNQIQALANKTPFTTQAQGQSAQMLLNYGIPQSQILPLERSISDITSATPDPQGNLSSISLAIGQIASKGAIRGQEFNQLANAGVPINQIVAQAYGIDPSKVQKTMQSGALPADKLLTAIRDMNIPALQNLQGFSEKQSQTLGGTWSTFTSELQQSAASAMSRPATEISTQLPKFGADLATAMNTAAPGAQHLLASLLTMADHALPLLAPLVNSVANGIGTFVDRIIPWIDRESQNHRLVDDMDHLGQAWAQAAPLIGPLAGDFADLSTNFVTLGVDSLPLVLPLLDDLVRFLDSLERSGPFGKLAVEGLVLAFVGFKTVAPIVSGIRAIATALDILTVSETGAAAAGGGAFLGRLGIGGLSTAGKLGVAGVGAGAGLYAMGQGGKADQKAGGASQGGFLGYTAGGALVGGGIGTIVPGVGTLIGGGIGALGGAAGYGLKHLFGLADGGTTTSSGSVLVGERGPEILSLPTGATVAPLDKAAVNNGRQVVFEQGAIRIDGVSTADHQKLVDILLAGIQDQLARQ